MLIWIFAKLRLHAHELVARMFSEILYTLWEENFEAIQKKKLFFSKDFVPTLAWANSQSHPTYMHISTSTTWNRHMFHETHLATTFKGDKLPPVTATFTGTIIDCKGSTAQFETFSVFITLIGIKHRYGIVVRV